VPSAPLALVQDAPAKINLTLTVCGRRADGYHQLESLVVFAQFGDRLRLEPGAPLGLDVAGPFARVVGADHDNLVLKAARELARRSEGLELGRFTLIKRLPVAAGLGGGSADAAAALRLLAQVNAISSTDSRLANAARSIGADVLVCLDPRPRIMRGLGDELSNPLRFAPVAAVLVNPGIPVVTSAVFAALEAPLFRGPPAGGRACAEFELPGERHHLLEFLCERRNDLEPAAIRLAPVIAEVLAYLGATNGCELARMSGSGATCFGLFKTNAAALAAARHIALARPHWWVQETVFC
jgi:4-diphosphocytidyl-2-C-methyl-D-erythritol kinase